MRGLKTVSLGRSTGIIRLIRLGAYRTTQFSNEQSLFGKWSSRINSSGEDRRVAMGVFEIPHSDSISPSLRSWGCSSVGRAVALQAIGQEFESPQLHQLLSQNVKCRMRNFRRFCNSQLSSALEIWACSSVG